MDAKLIDIDNFNFEQPHNYAIINGVLMNRNLMGYRIQGITAYSLARNGERYGHTICPICNVAYSNFNTRTSNNHDRSARHKNAVKGKFQCKKRKNKVY